MFLAIINDSYVEVKGELSKKHGKMTLIDWVRLKINRIINRRYGSHPDPPDDPMITYDEYKNELIKAGYKEQDIIDAFTKINVENKDGVTQTGMIRVGEAVNEILNRKKEIKEEYQQYIRVRRRIDALETALGESSHRLDTILNMLIEGEDRKTVFWEIGRRRKCSLSDTASISDMKI